MREYIAYRGTKFSVEWYFDDSGKSQVLEYYNLLSPPNRRKILVLFKRIGDFGLIMDKEKFRNEGSKIYAFKPHPHRFLSFFFSGSKIVVTNAFMKKCRKLPIKENNKSIACREDYINRVEKGVYYE